MGEDIQDDGEFRGWLRGKIQEISADIAEIKAGMENINAQLELHGTRITVNEQWRENHDKQHDRNTEREFQEKKLSSKSSQFIWQRIGIVAAIILSIASMITAWLLNA